MEQELEIRTNGEYKNLNLITKFERDGQNVKLVDGKTIVKEQGLEVGNFVIVEKVFAEGRDVPSKNAGWSNSFTCKATYLGEEVSFWLKPVEHDQYKDCGGIGDKVKISLIEVEVPDKKTGKMNKYENLRFELVE